MTRQSLSRACLAAQDEATATVIPGPDLTYSREVACNNVQRP
jgi:hypothetical protein